MADKIAMQTKGKRGRKPKYETKTCPNCGLPYRSTVEREVNGHVYVYAVHQYKDENGKWRKYECYLGPKEQYIHAEKFNDFGLKGGHVEERFVEYLERILRDQLTVDRRFDFAKGIQVLNTIFNLLNEKAETEDEKQLLLETLEGLKAKVEKGEKDS
uniref:Uncharacterized protein n=1 Tax=Sulfolobus neozealandicus TaxID=299422 RepID=Q5DVF8_9CREN|nr:hypothetical protein [Sulfolobus neozealandicus]